MKKLLYIWEYGSGLGHVGSFFPIAKQLRQEGWVIKFYIPLFGDSTETIVSMLESFGFEHCFIPGAQYRRKREIHIKSHVDLLYAIDSFSADSATSYFVKAWKQIFFDEAPDLVIGDFAVLPIMIARALKIATMVIDAGYYYPEVGVRAIKPFLESSEFDATNAEASLAILTRRITTSFRENNLPLQVDLLGDIFACDKLIINNFSQLTVVKHPELECLGGNVYGIDQTVLQKVKWNSTDPCKPKIFCYLHLDSVSGISLFKAINHLSFADIIVYSPSLKKFSKEKYDQPNITLYSDPIAVAELLMDADLVVSHGGIGLINQALWAGVPLLISPTHFEQKLNAEKIAALGYGINVYGGHEDISYLISCVLHVLENPVFKFRARSFRQKNEYRFEGQVRLNIASLCERSESNRPRRQKKLNNKLRFGDLDTIFLSFDEENADRNWQDLLSKNPKAKRIHGVKGFDASHKAAADASSTERFILVDGDTQVDRSFFEITVEVPTARQNSVWQWCSRNIVNGLCYAAGGVKIWPTELVKAMKSHENSKQNGDSLLLDFWDQPGYEVFRNVYSDTFINGSPFQAFRSGFREGVKYGVILNANPTNQQLIKRIAIFCSAGIDSEFGSWAIYGACRGLVYAKEHEYSQESLAAINCYEALYAIFTLTQNDFSFESKQSSRAKELPKRFLIDVQRQALNLYPYIPIAYMTAQDSMDLKRELALLQQANTYVFALNK